MLEVGATQVLQEVLPESARMSDRGSAQQRPALGGEGREIAAFVALEDAALDEALAFELIDRPGHAAGGEDLVLLGPGEEFTVTDAAPGTRFMLMAGKPYGEAPEFNGPFVD